MSFWRGEDGGGIFSFGKQRNGETGLRLGGGGCLLVFLLGLWVLLGLMVAQYFLHFQGVRVSRSRRSLSEVRQNLRAIANLQYQYREEAGDFAGGPECFSYLNWAPLQDTVYTYYCGEDHIPCSKCKGLCPSPPVFETGDGFTISAVGNVDQDAVCDFWTINDQGVMSHYGLSPSGEVLNEGDVPERK